MKIRKFLLPLFAFLFGFLIISVILLQRALIPAFTDKLEKFLSENTPYKIKISPPRLKPWGVHIPQIELAHNDKKFYLKDISLRPELYPLLYKVIKLRGEGRFALKDKYFPFEVKEAIYNWEEEALKSDIEFKTCQLKDYIEALSHCLTLKIQDLESTSGIVMTKVQIHWQNGLSVKLSQSIQNAFLEYKNYKFKETLLLLNFDWEGGKRELSLKGINWKIIHPISYISEIKNGSFSLRTDFKRVNMEYLKFWLNDTKWEGSLFIKDIKRPLLTCELHSGPLDIRAEVEQKGNYIYYALKLTKEREFMEVRGSYKLKRKTLTLEGKGKTTLKGLAPLLSLPIKNILKDLEATLLMDAFKLSYSTEEGLLGLDLNTRLEDIKFKREIIAQRGELKIRMGNGLLKIDKLQLGHNRANLNLVGYIDLRNDLNSSLTFAVSNYSFRIITRALLEKDFGDAKLDFKGYLKGKLKRKENLKSLVGWRFSEGEIGKLKFLSQIATLLNKAELAQISFKEGYGTLYLDDAVLTLKDTKLISPHLELYASGEIFLDGTLNLTLLTKFPKEGSLFKLESPLSKIDKIIFKGLHALFYKIKVRGNIKKPVYIIVPAPIDKLINEFFPLP